MQAWHTHADTSCAGRHIRILEYVDGPTYNVAPFHSNYKPLEKIGMINGIAAVDTENAKGYILELNNFLDFTNTMDHFLLCPMQARVNGVEINNVPQRLCPTINKDSQNMIFKEDQINIPINFHGPIPYIPI